MFAILFPGQGSQFRGMGADVFGHYPGITRFACDLLGYDLPARCRDNQDDVLARTECTQPALFTVNALHAFEREHREGGPPTATSGTAWGSTTRSSPPGSSTSRPVSGSSRSAAS